ncbi:hypothetical protein HMPREF3204_00484 [Gardnerella pickettii]|nr:hypothetical protein HMPREF3204_00484 [Gardnerella pickettii]
MDCLPSQISQKSCKNTQILQNSQNHDNQQELTKPAWEAGTRLTTQLQP